MKILIIQTAFLGDLILSLPVIQVIKNNIENSSVDILCYARFANVLDNNPYINEIIKYDKRDKDSGVSGFKKVLKTIKGNKYDVVISIQRFLRSTLLSKLSGALKTISFDNSTSSFLYSDRVKYKNTHEILRNFELLKPLGINQNELVTPQLFPSEKDNETVNKIFQGLNIKSKNDIICIAPGSVWFTKRFPLEKFVNLLDKLSDGKFKIALIGGAGDSELCENIISKTNHNEVYNYAGKLSLLQSTELIKRCALLITNDSAPLHIGNAVGTKVIALFGSTVKDYGFYPIGKNDKVFEVKGLECRPCTNHGKHSCPIDTFLCMNNINVDDIVSDVKSSLLNII